ncbi:MAG TPA: hypothetical protein VK601_21615 [Kofleriaceae bacterium]|nr:hypothetical protein [Kofleriaceae bacterium]
MPHHHGLRTAMLGTLVLSGAAGCDKDKLKGPEAEVHKAEMKLSLPAVPAFDLPPAPSDGSHTVKELRVKGKKLLETDITVKGVITWTYDCPTAIRQPGMSDKDLQKMIEEDPSKCERPKFYIGDAADTPAEKSLWVVEVPRPYYKVELERLPKDELRNPPPDRCDAKGDPKKSACPPYKVGDQVEITGTWRLTSPHSERNSDGLLVYKRMKNVTQTWDSPEPKPGATPPSGPAKPTPQDMVNRGGKSSG